MSNGGFYLVARSLLSHPRLKPCGKFSDFEAWHWLVASAAYAPTDVPVMVGKRHDVIKLDPGQLSFSIRFLAEAWQWSPNRVQRFIDALVSDGSILAAPIKGQTVVTLCNWVKHQRPNFKERTDTQSDTQSTSAMDTQSDTARIAETDANSIGCGVAKIETDTQSDTASKKRTDTQTDTKKKERKESKKDIPHSEGFEQWYSAYPRKVGKLDASKAYRKVTAGGLIDHETLVARTRVFAALCSGRPKDDRRFIPYPATWLNGGRFLDEPEDAPPLASIEAPKLAVADFSESDWRKRLAFFAEKGEWAAVDWGPRPGAPGCLVPPRLLISAMPVSGEAVA